MTKNIDLLPWPKVAKEIKRILKEKEIPQQRIADDLKVCKTAVSRWLSLYHEPLFPHRVKLIGWLKENA